MSSLPSGTVTLLFIDIEGSTRLLRRLGDRYASLLADYRSLLRHALQKWGGQEVDTQGEGLFASFSRARDAVQASVAIQHTLASHPWPEGVVVRARIGLHTGEPLAGETGYVGMDVHRAARICAASHGGQILLSEATRALVENDLLADTSVRDLGEHRLKDLTRPLRIFQVVVSGLPSDFPPLRSLDVRPHNLPIQPTPFIGRAREINAATSLLSRDDVWLVTFTGAAGSGKTRLALQVASDLIDHFAEGAFFVSLAALTDPALVASAIVHTLQVPESQGHPLEDNLKDYLWNKHMLLVLDNFEQVVEAGPLLADLRTSAPALKLIVTSRVPLHLSGEHEFPVQPLALPDLGQLPSMSLEVLARDDAMQLFVQRARAAKPSFALTEENAQVVAEICHRLDGLPLAIELAAPWIKLLPPQALHTRLERRLMMLTGGPRDLPSRQKTLRSAIDWSQALLSQGEQTLFARLAVCVGGCTLEAAEAICNAERDLPLDVIEGVALLVDKNLLRPQELGTEPRVTMLDTIREYALDRLESSSEAATVRRHYAEYFVAFAEEAEPKIRGPAQRDWLDRLEREHDNFRAILAWSQQDPRNADFGLRLAGSLCQFWWSRSYLAEALRWLEQLVAGTADVASRGRARVLSWTGQSLLAKHPPDPVRATALLEAGLVLSRDLNYDENVCFTVLMLGRAAEWQGDSATAVARGEEGLSVSRRLEDPWYVALATERLGEAVRLQGDYNRAGQLYEESLRLGRELGDERHLCIVLYDLGHVALHQRSQNEAIDFFRDSLDLALKIGDARRFTMCLEGFAAVETRAGRMERAARLFGAAEKSRQAIGAVFEPADRSAYEEHVNLVHTSLDEETFSAAWVEGRLMTKEDVVRYALS